MIFILWRWTGLNYKGLEAYLNMKTAYQMILFVKLDEFDMRVYSLVNRAVFDYFERG